MSSPGRAPAPVPPRDATPEESLGALIGHVELWSQHAADHPDASERACMLAHFGSDVGYKARWPLRGLLFADRADLLIKALDAGLPIEAPIAFHQGSLLCEAALVGAPACVAALAARGADMDASMAGYQTALELACSEAGESAWHLSVVRALVAGGSSTTREAREAARAKRRESLGLDVASERPLASFGRHALSSMGREWYQLIAWGRRQGKDSATVASDAAHRLEALRILLGQSHEDFFDLGEATLAGRLAAQELPGDIEAALVASREHAALLLAAPEAPSASKRATL